ncbi:type II asparaginase [Apibacter raozihei]|uniref:type II asparaginase n=1 Tax=Apibacter raozihei TaxID=2500547 RepID=UPI000FE42055|nr:type II asparaginase [Apibacter raozihei]
MNTKKIKSILSLCMLIVFITIGAQVKPTIYVLATGGTIAGTGKSSTTSAYKAGSISVEQLLDAVPDLATVANIKSEQIANIGSQDMNFQVWLKLVKRINELSKDPNINGFVITHGTDTQDETAYFLNLTAKTSKPIVLVGAMRPSTALSADGPRNLFNAVACAASPESIAKGVMVVMDDKIIGADDISKTNTLSVGSFDNPNFGPLGIMYNGKPIYTRTSKKKNTIDTEFDVTKLDKLPRVDIILGYVNTDKVFVDAALNAGAKGLVYAGVGNGNMSGEVLNALSQSVKKGIPVVRSSRLPAGPTCQWDEIDDDAHNFSASWYLTPQRSRILLMLALTKTTDYREIQRMFTEY